MILTFGFVERKVRKSGESVILLIEDEKNKRRRSVRPSYMFDSVKKKKKERFYQRHLHLPLNLFSICISMLHTDYTLSPVFWDI